MTAPAAPPGGAAETEAGTLVWQPEGKLGWLAEVGMPALWLEQLEKNGGGAVLVDLHEVVGIDSGGLRTLANLVETALRGGARKVILSVCAPRVHSMLLLAQFDLLCELRLGE